MENIISSKLPSCRLLELHPDRNRLLNPEIGEKLLELYYGF